MDKALGASLIMLMGMSFNPKDFEFSSEDLLKPESKKPRSDQYSREEKEYIEFLKKDRSSPGRKLYREKLRQLRAKYGG